METPPVANSDEVVVDTTVLVGANSILTERPKSNSKFQRRLNLLTKIRKGSFAVLISEKLLQEYQEKIPMPRNDFVIAFFKIIDSKGAISNYSQWRHNDIAKARECRYPRHDDHILRTAWRDHPTTIVTEDGRMLGSGDCIYREFRVRIQDV